MISFGQKFQVTQELKTFNSFNSAPGRVRFIRSRLLVLLQKSDGSISRKTYRLLILLTKKNNRMFFIGFYFTAFFKRFIDLIINAVSENDLFEMRSRLSKTSSYLKKSEINILDNISSDNIKVTLTPKLLVSPAYI